MESPFDKPFPYYVASEKALLSCIMQRPSILLDQNFSEDMFGFPHNFIFRHLAELATEHESLNWDMVLETFSLARLSEIGGKQTLNEVLFHCPTWEGWEFSYKLVLEAYQRRRHMEFAMTQYARCMNLDQPFDPDALVKFDPGLQPKAPESDTYSDAKAAIEQMFDKTNFETRIHLTGIKRLDQVLGYVRAGNVIVIGAQTSQGKSAMAHNIAANACWGDALKKVAVFSMEMTKDEVWERIFASKCNITMSDIRDRDLDGNDRQKMEEFVTNKLKPGEHRLTVVDETINDVAEIVSRCRRIKKRFGLDLVIVDYIQLISPAGAARNVNRQIEVASISRTLKVMARELKVVVVSLSQLNESDHLRESRAIGHDADVVLHIVEKKETDGSLRHIQIVKARNGATGEVDVDFFPPYASFSDRPE
jgi:replicative DNA helicase